MTNTLMYLTKKQEYSYQDTFFKKYYSNTSLQKIYTHVTFFFFFVV